MSEWNTSFTISYLKLISKWWVSEMEKSSYSLKLFESNMYISYSYSMWIKRSKRLKIYGPKEMRFFLGFHFVSQSKNKQTGSKYVSHKIDRMKCVHIKCARWLIKSHSISLWQTTTVCEWWSKVPDSGDCVHLITK